MVVRAVVVLCRKSGGAVLRTPFLPRCRAARDLTGPLYPVVAWGQASGPSRPITPIQCIGLRSRCRHQTRAPVLKLTRDPRRHPRRPGADTGLTKSSREPRALFPGTRPQPPLPTLVYNNFKPTNQLAIDVALPAAVLVCWSDRRGLACRCAGPIDTRR